MYKIKDMSEESNISIRMLRYYDEIGLLKPSSRTTAGYRLYDDNDLEKLFTIIFYKELDFSLNEIKEIISKPNFEIEDALIKHKSLLLKKVERLNKMISVIDDIHEKEGGLVKMKKITDMSEIDFMKDQFEAETREKYGTTNEYKESINKTKNYSKEDWNKIMLESEEIFKAFHKNTGENVTSDQVQELVVKWKNHISNYYYDCSIEILAGLGKMYISDERFKQNIDKHGVGTADFMSEAIKYYCDNNRN